MGRGRGLVPRRGAGPEAGAVPPGRAERGGGSEAGDGGPGSAGWGAASDRASAKRGGRGVPAGPEPGARGERDTDTDTDYDSDNDSDCDNDSDYDNDNDSDYDNDNDYDNDSDNDSDNDTDNDSDCDSESDCDFYSDRRFFGRSTRRAGHVAPATVAAGYYLVLRSAPVGTGRKVVRGANPRVPYRLIAAVESGPDDLEQEPNDEPARATDIASGGTRTGYLSPPGDVDWYRIRAEQPMILHAEVSALERADLELSVLAAGAKPGDKPQLLARANEGGVREGEVLPNVRVPAGESFIKVEAAARELDGKWVRDSEDRDHSYRLSAQLLPDDGSTDREPNNDVENAQAVELPATVRGWIWPRRDVDLFRFHVAAGAPPVTLRVSPVRGVDLQLRLLELRGSRADVIGTADAVRGEGEEQMVAVPLKEGDYLVEVSSPRGKDASATQQYTLTVR